MSPCRPARCNSRTRLALACALLLAPAVATAHPQGLSGLHLLVWRDHARAILTIHTRDTSTWFPHRDYPDYVPGVCRAMTASANDILQLSLDDRPPIPLTRATASSPEPGLLELDIDYDLPAHPLPARMHIRSGQLARLPPGHQQVLQVDDMRAQPLTADNGHYLHDDILDLNHDTADFDLPQAPHPATRAAATQSLAQPMNSRSPPSIAAAPPPPPAAPVNRWLLLLAGLVVLVFATRRSHHPRRRMATDP